MSKLIEEGMVLWPSKDDGRPRLKRFLANLSDTTTGFSTVQELGFTTDGTREITELMGFKAFDFPKPISLVEILCSQATDDRTPCVVLDFFAGSGTTANAVMSLNAKDGGQRRADLQTPFTQY